MVFKQSNMGTGGNDDMHDWWAVWHVWGRREYRIVVGKAEGNRPYIIYNKPTRCNSGSIVFIKNYKYALHVTDALCVHLQEHYKL